MLISLEWLRQYVHLSETPEQLARDLTMLGLNVEGLEHRENPLGQFVVGRVLECGRHPDADKLSVCRVDVGEDQPRPVVCGAPNVREGQTVSVILPGRLLPDGTKIKKTKLRGQKSEGMICSEIEMGLGTDAAGILELDTELPPGTPLSELYGGEDWTLLPADQMWALVLWYQFSREIEKYGQVQDAEKKFIVLSHTTSDANVLLARKHGLGVIKTWVGFAALAAAVRDVWQRKPITKLTEGREDPTQLCHPFVCEYQDIDNGKRSINVAAMEQSNGYSILGGPPPDARSLGTGGHVRDKDGTLAALLVAEIAAWAKQQGTTIYELIDRHIHLDPDVGLFVTHYEPDPIDGEYPGIQGDRKKKDILRRALGYFQLALAGDVEIGGLPVTSAVIYRTGKYDAIYEPSYDFQFPDEGVRFYFGNKLNHVTVRPSGTGNSLRFHVQLHAPNPQSELVAKKQELLSTSKAVADHLRELLKAPRS